MIARQKLVELLRERSPDCLAELYATADRVRACTVGDAVQLRALIEISSFCRRNCYYCGLRNSNRKIYRYRMTDREIVAAACAAAARGRRTVVLQSGEDTALRAARVARLVRRIKNAADVAVTLSLGEYARDDYHEMRASGADRYLLKHETVDPDIYEALHPGMSLDQRIRCLVWLKEAGFQIGSGFIVGLPGQTAETIADDIIFLRRLGVHMAGVGPFIPHPETPLRHVAPGRASTTLTAVALIRLALPYARIPATTALGTLIPDGAARALQAGADVLMPGATPQIYWHGYDLYPNRARMADTGSENVVDLVHSLGRTVATDYGHCTHRHDHPEPFDITALKRALAGV